MLISLHQILVLYPAHLAASPPRSPLRKSPLLKIAHALVRDDLTCVPPVMSAPVVNFTNGEHSSPGPELPDATSLTLLHKINLDARVRCPEWKSR